MYITFGKGVVSKCFNATILVLVKKEDKKAALS